LHWVVLVPPVFLCHYKRCLGLSCLSCGQPIYMLI
jgi:hypothetical protein